MQGSQTIDLIAEVADSAEDKRGCDQRRQKQIRLIAYLTLTTLVLIVFTPQTFAQGCTQCLDSTQATPPAVQAAYRHAILLLAGTAVTLFTAGTLLLRRHR